MAHFITMEVSNEASKNKVDAHDSYIVVQSNEPQVHRTTRTHLKNSVGRKIRTGMRPIYVQHHLFILKSYGYKKSTYLPRLHTYPRKIIICTKGGTCGNTRMNENAVGTDDAVT